MTPPIPVPADPGQAPIDPGPTPVPVPAPAVGVTHPTPDTAPATTDRPHFVRIQEGQPDLCGQCGQAWPCPDFQQQIAGAVRLAGAAPEAESVVSLDRAAQVAGMTTAEFLERAAALNTDRLP